MAMNTKDKSVNKQAFDHKNQNNNRSSLLSKDHAQMVFHELSKFQRENLLSGIITQSKAVDPICKNQVVFGSRSNFENCDNNKDITTTSLKKPKRNKSFLDLLQSIYPESSSNIEYESSSSESKKIFQRRLESLNELRVNKSYCDVILVSEDNVEYECHRAVLAACSDYFRAMFTHNMLELKQERIIMYILQNELQNIIHFMYTGEINTQQIEIDHYLAIAVYYQINQLIDVCVEILVSQLDINSCCDSAYIAHELSLLSLKEPVHRFISQNIHKLFTFEIELLPFQSMNNCLENIDYGSTVSCDAELGVLKSCLRWCRFNKNMTDFHSKIINHVRFSLIKCSDIKKELSKLDLNLDSKPVIEWFSRALEYHQNVFIQPRLQNKDTQIRNKFSSFVKVDGVASQHPVCIQTEHSRISVSNDFITDLSLNLTKDEDLTLVNENNLPIRDPFHSVVVLEGFVYVIGGTRKSHNGFSRIVERYDPRTNEWIEVASMNQERADFSACVLDGCIIVAGGRGIRRYLSTCEKYDPSTNTWKYIASLPQAIYMAAVVVSNGVLHLSGGFNEYEALDEMLIYNNERNRWVRQRGFMMKCRGYHVMIESPKDGNLWVIGGVDNPFSGRNVWKVEAWNVAMKRWMYVGEILPVKMFTSTMRLNVVTNHRKNITVFPATNPEKYGTVEYYQEHSMWLESKNPTLIYEIEENDDI